MLLQEGEYSQKEKAVKKKFEIYSTAYWCIATAIYLGWSFLRCAVGLYLDSVAGSGCIIWCSVSSCKRDLGNTGFNQDIILFADTCKKKILVL